MKKSRLNAVLGLAMSAMLMVPAVAESTLRFAIQIGSGSSADSEAVNTKYRPLTEMLAGVLKQPVSVKVLSPFRQFDVKDLEQQDVVLVRPAMVSGWMLRSQGFEPLAALDVGHEPPDRVVFLAADPAVVERIKTPAGMKGLRFVMSRLGSETQTVAIGLLRDRKTNMSDISIFNVQEQGAIPFALDSHMADVGVVKRNNSSFAKYKNKYTILFESDPLPGWMIVGHKRLGAAKLNQLRQVLKNTMNVPEQKTVMQSYDINNVRDSDGQAYISVYNRYVLSR